MKSGLKRLFAGTACLITSDVCAIALFSYLGVLARVKITGHLFSARHILSDEEAFFYPLFYNSYFVPNIIGCFFIAIFQHQKSKVIHSALSPLYLSFCVGAITGFCGSLTTFSSWAFSIAVNMFDIGVPASLVLMAIQLVLLQASLSVGISCCSLFDWVLIPTDVTQQEEEEEDQEQDHDHSPTPTVGENNTPPSGQRTELAGVSDQAVPAQTVCHLEDARRRATGEVQEGVRMSDGLREENSSAVDPATVAFHQIEAATTFAGEIRRGVGVRSSIKMEGKSYRQQVFVMWFALLVLSTIAIWVMIIVYSYYPPNQSTDKDNTINSSIDIDTLRSVALAPFGAVLRYSLWNIPSLTPYITENVPTLKVPTLTANVLGTLFLSLSSSIAVSGSEALYTSAFNQGFCGSLTTASTFVMELHTLHGNGGGNGGESGVHVFATIRYGLVTIVSCLLVSLFVLWGTKTHTL